MSRSFPRIVLASILIVALIHALGFTVFINAPLAAVVHASEASVDWPMEGHDPGHTRYSGSETLDTGHLLWKSDPMNYSYPIVADGRLYVRAGYNDIQCFNATTGAILWRQQVTSEEIIGEYTREGDNDWLGVRVPSVAYSVLIHPPANSSGTIPKGPR